MVKKLKKTNGHQSHHRHVTLHHHHHKPFRKRHVGLFVVSFISLLIVLALLISYRDAVISGVNSSKNFVSDLFTPVENSKATIDSKYGFNVTYDRTELFANAVDGKTGVIYRAEQVEKPRAYTKIQFASLPQKDISDQSAVTISYHAGVKGELTDEALENVALESVDLKREKLEFVRSEKVKIDDKDFTKSVWKTTTSAGVLKNLTTSLSLYTSHLNGHPFTVVVNEGFVDVPGEHPRYHDLIQSIRFSLQTAITNKGTVASKSVGDTVVDTLLMARTASAQSSQRAPTATVFERISALYSPAVVRVYNSYCADIEFDKNVILRDACSSMSGSGFFVGQNGYVATNGHVASADARDIAIYNAFAHAVSGDARLINMLAAAAKYTEKDITPGTKQEDAIGILAEKLYSLENSRFKKVNDVQNLLVALSNEKPETEKLIADTRSRKKYEGDPSIVHAEVKATDFRLIDGIAGFHASDMALIKVEGISFPVVQLGSVNDVSQGGDISILGFPGDANENGIVDSTSSTATLTTGKVSAIKKVDGTDNMVIETDTVIGNGSSGGPAFGNTGTVVGITTYSVGASGNTGGAFNYIRDASDIVELAKKSSIQIDTNSKTQAEWDEGLSQFFKAHYTSSLEYFKRVKQLYPLHNKVDEFIATAEKRIVNGEDIKDFPIVQLSIAVVLFSALVFGSLILIIRHKKNHNVYNAGVSQGVVTPFDPAAKSEPQHVAVSKPSVQKVEKPGTTSTDVSVAKDDSNQDNTDGKQS